jgi:hypothetical protein
MLGLLCCTVPPLNSFVGPAETLKMRLMDPQSDRETDYWKHYRGDQLRKELIRREEVRADEQQNDIGFLQACVDLIGEILSRIDFGGRARCRIRP